MSFPFPVLHVTTNEHPMYFALPGTALLMDLNMYVMLENKFQRGRKAINCNT